MRALRAVMLLALNCLAFSPGQVDAAISRGPYLQTLTMDSVTVCWRADTEGYGRVQFGLTTNELSWEVTGTAVGTNQAVTLTNLAPGTMYYYAIGAGSGQAVGGPDYHFTTAPNHAQSVRIWAIGDSGTASLGSTAPLLVRDAYKTFSASRPTDVWLMLGDNAYYSGTDEEFQTAVFDVFPEFLRTTAVWPTLGNHDTYSTDASGLNPYFGIFSLPRDGQAGGVPSGQERYYSFDYANVHFVCLDSESIIPETNSPMLMWLEQDLAASTAEWLIAYWHSPPYSRGSHNSDLEENLVTMRRLVVPILESYGVDLVLCGHSHSYERSYLMNGHYGPSSTLTPSMVLNNGSGRVDGGGAYQKPETGVAQGTVYVVAGNGGQTGGGPLNHPAMYISLNRLGSMVIDVESNRLEAKFVRETGVVDDYFTMSKGPQPPSIVAGPESQVVAEGIDVTFGVTVVGTPPLSYQWIFNGAALDGATNFNLLLTNVDTLLAGSYSVRVTNQLGAVTSAPALLTVLTNLEVCRPLTSGLVAWWPAEGNARDAFGTNHGILMNGAGFADGIVGQAFRLDGVNDFVLVPDSSTLDLSNELSLTMWFKAEAWNIGQGLLDKRSLSDCNYGAFVNLGYGFQLYYAEQSGGFRFSQSPVPSAGIFHHFVGTFKQATTTQVQLKTYIDGLLVRVDLLDGNLANAMNGAPIAIGSERGGVADFFHGLIDEVTIYNRVLSDSEVLNSYLALSKGACAPKHPPQIVSGPTSRTVVEGATAEYQVTATGTAPLAYQWYFNQQPVQSGTDSLLVLTNVQLSQAGDYSVVISNAYGVAISPNVQLTVLSNGTCLPSSDLVAWWPAEGDARDAIGTNHGQLMNGAGFTAGRVGQGFNLDGVNDFVLVPDSPTLDLTNEFSIACWFKATDWSAGQGLIDKRSVSDCNYGSFVNSQFGFQLYFQERGHGFRFCQSSIPSAGSFHYFVGTFKQSGPNAVEMKIFMDGFLAKEETATGNLANSANSAALAIGSERAGVADFFKGVIDEVALYKRALSADEVLLSFHQGSVSPCAPGLPPYIVGHPTGQNVLEGSEVTLDVTVAGTRPFFYQWLTDGGIIPDATNEVLSLPNIGLTQTGNYWVLITNAFGSATSAVAHVTVVPPPSVVRALDVTASARGSATIPVELVGRNTENAIGFSLSVNPTLFRFVEVELADSLHGHATLILNTNQSSLGRVGVAVALPAGEVFPGGTQQLVRITFDVLADTPQAAPIAFGDQPTAREVSDRLAKPLPGVYVAGSIQITPAEYEADVSPRPTGDRVLSIVDWVQIGRFAAGLDAVTPAEFQRVDCAPLSTKGNGVVTVADWVQAGRFAAGLEAPTVIGGPSAPEIEPPPGGGGFVAAAAVRELWIPATNVVPSGTLLVPVLFSAQGNENAVGFSLAFDTNKVRFLSTADSPSLSGATLIVNSGSADRIGILLALPTGVAIPAGQATLVFLRFVAATNATGTTPVELVDTPVVREAVDVRAASLSVNYANGLIQFGSAPPGPRLTITRSGPSLLLIWPSSPGFQLYSSSETHDATWTKVPIAPIEAGGQMIVSVSVTGVQQFFRLARP